MKISELEEFIFYHLPVSSIHFPDEVNLLFEDEDGNKHDVSIYYDEEENTIIINRNFEDE